MREEVRYTQSARKHRIGRAHARHVMDTAEPVREPGTGQQKDRLTWTGPDDRGVELEIVAVDLPDYLLVIHVMPANFRRNR
ncbi:MAG: hypothetical protein M3Z25_07325 [Actinomycetota bacterium]|nr:hypothetical protein [Actinomycetota bacterium]